MEELTGAMGRVTMEDVTPHAQIVQPERLTRQSRFLVTINTNLRPRSNEEAARAAEDFKQALERVLPTAAQTGDLFVFLEGGPADLVETTIRYNLEVGKERRGGRLHSHALVFVKHHAKIRYDAQFTAHAVAQAMADPAVTKCYVNVALLPTDVAAENYLLKTGYAPGAGGAGAGRGGD